MATIKRNASAKWSGTGKEGKGAITTQSGVLNDTPYGFSRRFGDEKGTNPEELIAAAHASCFTDDGYGRKRPCSAGYKAKHAK